MQFFGKSDTGMKRRENQDSFVTEQLYDDAVLCLVCDGMGGANGGKTASEMACSDFVKHLKKKLSDCKSQDQLRFDGEDDDIENTLKKAVYATNTAVFKKAQKNKDLAGMGTTIISALVLRDVLYITHVGDSRLYFINEDSITQVTRDHSYVQTLIDLGQITPEEASNNPHKNIITRAIGTQKKVEPDIIFQNLAQTDVKYLLLCSDGLTNYVDDNTIHSIIKESKSLEECCNALIDKANENGGGDNITAVLISLDKPEDENQTTENTETADNEPKSDVAED